MVAKGNTVPMDLSRYETTSAEYLSFLTFSWSITADVDIESEALRWMGWLRMEVYTVWRVLNLRKYEGKLTYLPPNAKKLLKLPSLGTELDKNDGWVSMEDKFVLFWVSQVSRAGEQMLNHPQSLPDDGLFHIFFIRYVARYSKRRLLIDFSILFPQICGSLQWEYFSLSSSTDSSWSGNGIPCQYGRS